MQMHTKFVIQFALFPLLILFVAVLPPSAQERVSIKGTVVDKTTGAGLENVNISVEKMTLGAASDRKGNFFIENVPAGCHALRFSAVGYKELVLAEVAVEPGKTTDLHVFLQPTVLELREIVVTGTRSIHSLKDVSIETNLVSAKEISGVGLQTLTDAVRWVPGVNISGGAPNGAARRFTGMIHGLPAHYGMILVDGQRAKSEHIHTGVNLNLVPMGMIERIEVVKGPVSALYGSEAFGGVINIITKQFPEKSAFGAELSYGEYNTQNINVNHGATVGKVGYYINGNLIRTDGMPDVNDVKFGYDQFNLLSKFSIDAGENDRLRLSSRYYHNKYLRNASLPKVKDSWIDLSGGWQRSWGERSDLAVGLTYSHFQGEYRDDDNRTVKLDCVFNGIFLDNNALTAGAEIRNERFSRNATPQKEQSILGTFVKDEIKLSSHMTYITALRVDHHPNVGTEFTPKVGALYELSPDTDIRASVGKGFRAPSLQDLYEKEFNHKTYYRNGNPELKPEYSMSYHLSVEHRFRDDVLVRVSGFRNDFTDMIIALDTGDSLGGVPIFRRENVKEALAQGMEAELRLKISSFSAMLSHTYTDTKDDEDNPLAYSPKYMTNFRLYHYLPSLSFGTMLSIEDARSRYYKASGGQDKLNDYTLVSLSMNKKLPGGLTAFVRIENLMDQEFEIYEDSKSVVGYGRSFLGGLKFDY
jgi:outer membrane receptor for ferrienterochelin and colicins